MYWKTIWIFFKKLDINTGELINGQIKYRLINGQKQYRALTDDEEDAEWCNNQW